MQNKIETIPFVTEEGEEVSFYVIEQTTIAGHDYLLVTDEPAFEENDQDADVYIMKKVSDASRDMAVYEFVEEDQELDSISKVFGELLDDTDIIKQN